MGIATPWAAGCPATVCALPTKLSNQQWARDSTPHSRTGRSTAGRRDSHGGIAVRLDRRAGARAPRRRTRPHAAPPPVIEPLLDLASNDYLGLTRHPEITGGAADAALRWGGGATGSRLVTGTTELHAELERELAEFCGFEAALVLSSGYAANLAAVTALAPHGSLIVSDASNHASLIDGCRLARGATQVVPHADPDAVRKALDTHQGQAVVVSDSVFSVDGDAAPLAELARVAREFGAGLIVDDAHGLGVLGDGGRGAPQAAGLSGADGTVVTVTLSKSFGSQGGAVLGPARVIDHLVNTARTFIFDTGLAPAAAGAALAALRLLRREPERAERARAVASSLHELLTAEGLQAVRPDAAVVSVRAPSPRRRCAGRRTAAKPASPSAASVPRRCRTASHGCG